MATGSVPLLATVTLRVAVAVRPAPSRTVSPSVCEPAAYPAVFQLKVAVVAAPETVNAWAPSIVSVNAIGVPLAPLSDIPTLTVPLTGEPSPGLVNDATRGGAVVIVKVWAFETLRSGLRTVTEAEPVVAISAAVLGAVARPAPRRIVAWGAPFPS